MTLATTVTESVAYIDLNRPEQGNAMTPAMLEELTRLLEHYGADSATSLVVVTARGAHFCRGRDTSGSSAPTLPAGARSGLVAQILALYQVVTRLPVPVVACVQGDADGMGAALAGCADVTLIASTAHMSFPEIEHDIAPTLAMSAVLNSVPRKALAFLVYTAQRINAHQAVAMGLASAVLPGDAFADACQSVIQPLARRPRGVLETVKRYNMEGRDLTHPQASILAGDLMALSRPSL